MVSMAVAKPFVEAGAPTSARNAPGSRAENPRFGAAETVRRACEPPPNDRLPAASSVRRAPCARRGATWGSERPVPCNEAAGEIDGGAIGRSRASADGNPGGMYRAIGGSRSRADRGGRHRGNAHDAYGRDLG